MKTTGIVEYKAAMRLAGATVGLRAAAATRKTAASIERDAKINAPVDTGNLRSSGGTEYAGDGRNGVMTASVGFTASYSEHVERGTSRMAAQPFLRPATDRHVPGWTAALEHIAKGGLA